MPTCHCEERSDEAIPRPGRRRAPRAGDCFVAALLTRKKWKNYSDLQRWKKVLSFRAGLPAGWWELAMTGRSVRECVRQSFRRLVLRGARGVALRERVNLPHRRAAAPAPNPKSTFPRIYPMNPEPTVAPAQNRNSTFPRIYPMNPEPTVAPAQNSKSTFPRIYPMNPEPTAAPAQNRNSTFPRIYPMNPEPPAAPAQNPKSTISCINPSSLEPPAARFMTGMTAPSRQTYGFTRLPWVPERPAHIRTAAGLA